MRSITFDGRTCRARVQRADARRRRQRPQPKQGHTADRDTAPAPEAAELALPVAEGARVATPGQALDGRDVSAGDSGRPGPAQSVLHRRSPDGSIDGAPPERLPAVASAQAAAASEPRAPAEAACRGSGVAADGVPVQSSAVAASAARVDPAEADTGATGMDAAVKSAEQRYEVGSAPCGLNSCVMQCASAAGVGRLSSSDDLRSADAPVAPAAVEDAQPRTVSRIGYPQPEQPRTVGKGAIALGSQPGVPTPAGPDDGPDTGSDARTAEGPDSVPDAPAADPEACPRAAARPPGAELPGDSTDATAPESGERSGAEAGSPAAEVSHDPAEASAAELQRRSMAAAVVAEATDRAPDAQHSAGGPGDEPAPGWFVAEHTERELSGIRRRLEQHPRDASQQGAANRSPAQHAVAAVPDASVGSPSRARPASASAPEDAQHAEAGASLLDAAAQPETPVPSRVAPASPSDTTEPSQDETAVRTPLVACSKLEPPSVAASPAVDVGEDADAGLEAPAAHVRPQQPQDPSRAAQAQHQGTAVSGCQRSKSVPQAASAPVAPPATPPEHAPREAAGPPPPELPQQAIASADVSDALPVPAATIDLGNAALPLPEPSPRASAQSARGADPPAPSRDGFLVPCSDDVTAASDGTAQQRVEQKGASPSPTDALAAPVAAQQRFVAPSPAPQQPNDAGSGMEAVEVDIEASDADAAPTEHDADAAALVARLALQKEARVLLAPVAGCSRAVPQHAVTLLADLWGSATAKPGGVDAINSLAGAAQRRRVAAACWRDQTERRGCARAASRADVASLVDLLSPADCGAEPLQVGVCACMPSASPDSINAQQCMRTWQLQASKASIDCMQYRVHVAAVTWLMFCNQLRLPVLSLKIRTGPA